MIRKFLLTAALAVTVALAAPSASQAGFTLKINSTLITDGGVGDTDGMANGVISIAPNTVIDGYKFAFYTATTTSPLSVGGVYTVDQQGKISTAVANPPLVITVFSDGFTTPGLLTVNNTIGVSSAITTAKASSTITPGGTTADAVDGVNPVTSLTTNVAGSFSLSNTLTITGLTSAKAYNGTVTTDAFNPSPAPAGLILAALGLPAFGLLRRKFSKVVA